MFSSHYTPLLFPYPSLVYSDHAIKIYLENDMIGKITITRAVGFYGTIDSESSVVNSSFVSSHVMYWSPRTNRTLEADGGRWVDPHFRLTINWHKPHITRDEVFTTLINALVTTTNESADTSSDYLNPASASSRET